MDEKKDNDAIELSEEELDELFAEENCEAEDKGAEIPEFYFTNPDPYAKREPRPDDAPKHDVSFDENGNIVVKNPSAFWLPEIIVTDKIGGTEYTVTGSYEGTETLDKKLKRILGQNTVEKKTDITEDDHES